MLSNEILGKNRWRCFDCGRFDSGRAGCIRLDHWLAQMYLGAEARRQVVLDIALFDVAQNGSSRSVACLKDTRLERSMKC
jgi:hypothetical protein